MIPEVFFRLDIARQVKKYFRKDELAEVRGQRNQILPAEE